MPAGVGPGAGLVNTFDATSAEVDGYRVLALAAVVHSDQPAPGQPFTDLRRGVLGLGQPCPCSPDAVLRLPNRAERRAAVRAKTPLRVNVEHESTCPAVDASLRRWVR